MVPGYVVRVTERRREMPLEILVFVVGGSSLGAEIAAARLLAPWFGASTIVWANTIAIVLVALSIGYAIGGRLADRDPRSPGCARSSWPRRCCSRSCRSSAARSCAASVERLRRAERRHVRRLAARRRRRCWPCRWCCSAWSRRTPCASRSTAVADAGAVTGRLYAISTVGSLTGTFLSALLLIPFARHPADVPGLRAAARARGPARAWRGSGCPRRRAAW